MTDWKCQTNQNALLMNDFGLNTGKAPPVSILTRPESQALQSGHDFITIPKGLKVKILLVFLVLRFVTFRLIL